MSTRGKRPSPQIRPQVEDVASSTVKWLKWAAGLIGSLVILLGAIAWAGDTRYVQKEDFRNEIRYSADQLRKATLEDKIFDLTRIPENRRTNDQRAQLDRYNRQMNELNSRWQVPPPGGR